MGLPIQILIKIIQEHVKKPLEEPLLTLGRQDIMCNYRMMLQAFEVCDLAAEPLPDNDIEMAGCHIPNDRAFFGHLGLAVQSLDLSDFEHADIIHDLNLPVPEELKGRFKTVIDAGTLEHVFDLRQGFRNVADLLAPGGRVIHISPANNYMNHGFWQFSPTMLHDFYEANGFSDMQTELIIQPRDEKVQMRWGSFPYNPEDHLGINNFFSTTDTKIALFFRAKKTESSQSDAVPVQAYYRKAYEGEHGSGQQYILEATPEGGKVKIYVPT